jgi:hypothetical protein
MGRISLPVESSHAWSFLADNYRRVAAWTGVFLAPIKVHLINIFVLVAIDLATGVWRSWKLGDPLLSSKLRRTASKISSYGIAMLVVMNFERNFLPELMLIKIVSAYIALTEIKSIFENLHDATGSNVWKALSDKLKNWSLPRVRPRKRSRRRRPKRSKR